MHALYFIRVVRSTCYWELSKSCMNLIYCVVLSPRFELLLTKKVAMPPLLFFIISFKWKTSCMYDEMHFIVVAGHQKLFCVLQNLSWQPMWSDQCMMERTSKTWVLLQVWLGLKKNAKGRSFLHVLQQQMMMNIFFCRKWISSHPPRFRRLVSQKLLVFNRHHNSSAVSKKSWRNVYSATSWEILD